MWYYSDMRNATEIKKNKDTGSMQIVVDGVWIATISVQDYHSENRDYTALVRGRQVGNSFEKPYEVGFYHVENYISRDKSYGMIGDKRYDSYQAWIDAVKVAVAEVA